MFRHHGTRPVARLTPRTARRTEQLNHLLERERARSDRSGLELSLLLIGLDGRLSNGLGVDTLLEVVERRGRITDDAGRFDKRTAYVVLPDTTAGGARRFAESVQAAMSRRGVSSSYAIYSYNPSRGDDDASGGGGGGTGRVPAVARRIGQREPVSNSTSVALTQDPEPTRLLEPVMTCALPAWKRVMDLVVASTMLVLLWPVLVLIGLAVKLESRGPAVFRQKRTGLGGRVFEIYKFRTMRDGAEAQRDALLHINEQDGPAFKLRNDPRVTRLGAFLRKTSMDELPQLLNVIRGEMTLVGPRPLPCRESEACVGWQRRRLDVTPGLTCIWQVSGRSTVNFDAWVRMDLAYQRRFSLWQDLRILFATVPAVLFQRGAH